MPFCQNFNCCCDIKFFLILRKEIPGLLCREVWPVTFFQLMKCKQKSFCVAFGKLFNNRLTNTFGFCPFHFPAWSTDVRLKGGSHFLAQQRHVGSFQSQAKWKDRNARVSSGIMEPLYHSGTFYLLYSLIQKTNKNKSNLKGSNWIIHNKLTFLLCASDFFPFPAEWQVYLSFEEKT